MTDAGSKTGIFPRLIIQLPGLTSKLHQRTAFFKTRRLDALLCPVYSL
jgi:hypothetical protein